MMINKKTILLIFPSLMSLTMIVVLSILFASSVFAATTCPNTWQPAYAVDCIDPAYPYACGFSASGLPQCKASLPSTTCNGGTLDYNCNSCTANCLCPNGQILCSGTCKSPLSNSACTTQNREVDLCTGACGACKTGYTDCSGTCRPNTSPTCLPPSVYNACSGVCTAPARYIEASPAAAQADFIKITQDSSIGGMSTMGTYWNVATNALASPVTIVKGQNLLYGQINSGSTGGNLMLLEKGTGAAASPLFAINYNGRVGIGTSTPSYDLHVFGGNIGQTATGDVAVQTYYQAGGVTSPWRFIFPSSINSANFGAGAGNFGIYNSSSADYLAIFRTDGSLRLGKTLGLNIDSSGRVGISTSSPDVKLVVGNGSGAGNIIGINGMDNQYVGLRLNIAGPEKWFIGMDDRVNNSDLIFRSNGINYLVVSSTGDINISKDLCLGGVCRDSWPSGATNTMPIGVTGQTLRYGTSTWIATSNLYNNGVNIGIGTTTPNRLLHVASSTGNAEIDIQSGGKNHWAIYHDSSTEDLRIWNADAGGSNALILTNVGNAYVAGELKSTWLHVTSTDSNSFNSMANRLVVGVAQSVENAGDPNVMSKKATFYAFNNQAAYSGPTPNVSDQQATAIFGRSFYGHAGMFSNGFSSATAGNGSTVVAQNFNPLNTVSAVYAENFSNQAGSKAIQGISNSGWSGYFTGVTSTSKGVFATRLCLGSETDCKTSWSAVGGMPIGVTGQTLRYGTSTWIATSNLYNNGVNIGIGTTTPNRLLHVASSTGNAEIDIQSGGKNHWAIYHDSSTEDLRIWNEDVSGGNALKIKNVGDLFVARNFYASGEIKGDYLHASSTSGTSTIGHSLSISGSLCLGGVCKGAWPSGGVYIGKTTATYNGNRGSYGAADSLCSGLGGNFSGSHVCSNEEMFNSMRAGVSLPAGASVWVNSGPNAISNDCSGWKSNLSTVKGTYWSLDGLNSVGYTLDCSGQLSFACCK